ncbi:MAG TPA: archaeosortase C [Methanosarcinales archaeon]|nr:archaeosortase C [Methanosarcinales archaeon]
MDGGLMNIHNRMIIFLVLALFLGATMEYGHGSKMLGILLFGIALLAISRMTLKIARRSAHVWYAIIGIFIILADIAYNVYTQSELGTLDTMTFLLGISLIASATKNNELQTMGEFGIYVSITFIALFTFFYNTVEGFIHEFDHYAVLMPSMYLIRLIGISVDVIGTETVCLHAPGQDMVLTIGGPCSGLYSMFLLISIIVGYTAIENIRDARRIMALLGVTIVIAWIANLLRVSILYLVAYWYGQDVMMTVHTHLGWIIFVIVAWGLLLGLSKMERVERVEKKEKEERKTG